MKSFTAFCQQFENNPLWSFHIPVPEDIAQAMKSKEHSRVLISINGYPKLHRALMPDGNGGHYLMVNKELRKKMNLEVGDEVQVEIEPDNSKYGMAVPEEFSELLSLDEEGSHYFHKLTMGKQRSLIHIIATPKRSDTRLKKAVVVLEFLRTNRGTLDFKLLNEAFKDANRF